MRPFIRIATVAAVVAFTGWSYLDAGSFVLKKEEIPKAIQTLQSGNARDRADAAEQLGRRGAVRASDVLDAIPPLKNALKNDKEATVRKAAAEALGQIGRGLDTTIPLLLDAVKNDSSNIVQMGAISALGQIGPEAREALPELRKIASDKSNKKLSGVARLAVKSISAK